MKHQVSHSYDALLSPVYTVQPVVKPVVKAVWQPGKCLYTRYNRLTTGLTTGCIVYTNIQPVVKPVVQPVWQPVVSCKRGFKNYPLHQAYGENKLTVTRHVENVRHWYEHEHASMLAILQLRHQSATAAGLVTLSQLINVMKVTVTSYFRQNQNK